MMPSRRFVLAMFWLLLALIVRPGSAAAETRVALVIGNGAYGAAGRLDNPVNDAKAIAAALRSLDFKVFPFEDLDLGRFVKVISDFSDAAAGADVAVVFYAGHGMGLGGETQFLPVDADFRNEFEARSRTIGLSTLLSTLEGRAKTIIAFVDACRDNPLADRLSASQRRSGRSISVTRGLARIQVDSPDTLVVYATTPGRTAADGTGTNSPFTKALLAHLGTEGVEIEVLLKRVSAQVQELTGNKQEPERLSRLKREFYFKPAAPVVPVPNLTIPEADPNAAMRADFASAKAIGTVAAWDLFLVRYPSGFLSDLARREKAAISPPAPAVQSAPAQEKTFLPVGRWVTEGTIYDGYEVQFTLMSDGGGTANGQNGKNACRSSLSWSSLKDGFQIDEHEGRCNGRHRSTAAIARCGYIGSKTNRVSCSYRPISKGTPRQPTTLLLTRR